MITICYQNSLTAGISDKLGREKGEQEMERKRFIKDNNVLLSKPQF